METTIRYPKQRNIKSEVLEVHHCQVVPGSVMLLWGRRVETRKQTVWSEDPLVPMGRNGSPAWSAFGSSDKACLGTKRMDGTNVLHYSQS